MAAEFCCITITNNPSRSNLRWIVHFEGKVVSWKMENETGEQILTIVMTDGTNNFTCHTANKLAKVLNEHIYEGMEIEVRGKSTFEDPYTIVDNYRFQPIEWKKWR